MRPTIGYGDHGSLVMQVQDCLDVLPIDGDFGPQTEKAVRNYQIEQGFDNDDIDGIVGPVTWEALEEEFPLPPYPPPLPELLDPVTVEDIKALAADSALARYSWRDRGVAPAGYVKGMAIAYATIVGKFRALNSAAHFMARAATTIPARMRSLGTPTNSGRPG
jgi:hypothetical protein